MSQRNLTVSEETPRSHDIQHGFTRRKHKRHCAQSSDGSPIKTKRKLFDGIELQVNGQAKRHAIQLDDNPCQKPLTERQQLAYLLEMTAREYRDEQCDLLTAKKQNGMTHCIEKKHYKPTKMINGKMNKRNERGETALHLYAIRGDFEGVQEMIKQGADVNVKDYADWTPLHEASNHGHYNIVKKLLKAGADVNVKGLDADTPLHDACSNGHLEVVDVLLKYGADPLARNRRGETPCDMAVSDVVSDYLYNFMESKASYGNSSCDQEDASTEDGLCPSPDVSSSVSSIPGSKHLEAMTGECPKSDNDDVSDSVTSTSPVDNCQTSEPDGAVPPSKDMHQDPLVSSQSSPVPASIGCIEGVDDRQDHLAPADDDNAHQDDNVSAAPQPLEESSPVHSPVYNESAVSEQEPCSEKVSVPLPAHHLPLLTSVEQNATISSGSDYTTDEAEQSPDEDPAAMLEAPSSPRACVPVDLCAVSPLPSVSDALPDTPCGLIAPMSSSSPVVQGTLPISLTFEHEASNELHSPEVCRSNLPLDDQVTDDCYLAGDKEELLCDPSSPNDSGYHEDSDCLMTSLEHSDIHRLEESPLGKMLLHDPHFSAENSPIENVAECLSTCEDSLEADDQSGDSIDQRAIVSDSQDASLLMAPVKEEHTSLLSDDDTCHSDDRPEVERVHRSPSSDKLRVVDLEPCDIVRAVLSADEMEHDIAHLDTADDAALLQTPDKAVTESDEPVVCKESSPISLQHEANRLLQRSPSPTKVTWRKALRRQNLSLQAVVPSHCRSWMLFTKKYELTETNGSCDVTPLRSDHSTIDELLKRQQFELEKLQISLEQELFRVETRCLSVARQKSPLSACASLSFQMDDVFHKLSSKGKKDSKAHQMPDTKKLHLAWIEDIVDKYAKIEDNVRQRHQNELRAAMASQQLHQLTSLSRRERLRQRYLGNAATVTQ